MRSQLLLLGALTLVAFSGCIDDDVTDGTDAPAWQPGNHAHPAYGYPVTPDLPAWDQDASGIPETWRQIRPNPLPEEITGLQHRGNIPDAGSGAGIGIFGTLAVAGNFGGVGAPGTAGGDNDIYVVDISDPAGPAIAGRTTEGNAGDSEFIAYPDGRLVVVTSTRGQNMLVFDVTDPTEPYLLSVIETANGNHNHAVVPGTPIVYNNPSDGAGGRNDIWDLSDPENPVMVNDWDNGYGCHASSFFIDVERGLYRGYCAGLEVLQIWDVTDPVDPKVITDIPWPGLGDASGTIGSVSTASFAHLAMVNHDASVLIAGDESGGGAAPGCDYYTENPLTGETESGPFGNLWFYDISDEENPVLHGRYSPSAQEQRGSCTAHFGGVIDDTNHLVMAFYTAGVALVDFNDLDNPREVDLWKPGEAQDACTLCGVWDAQYYNGYVFTGDIDRGMDILAIG